jgi:hypothetical protein
VIDTTPGDVTPYLRLDEVLLGHAAELRRALGNNFVGLYPLGSLAIGDFDLTSDVDFAVVTAAELSDLDVGRAQSVHTALIGSDTRWVKHLEYSFFSMAELHRNSSPYGPDGRRVDAPERDLWYFANGATAIERSDHDNTLVTRWTLRYASRAVLGPEPPTFAPEIPATELREEIRNSLIGWERLVRSDPSRFDNRFHQVFLVLNDCRALQNLHEGRITSKRAGVTWAKEHLHARWRDLIEYCWQERQDMGIHVSQPADATAYRQTIEFMTYVAHLAERFEPLE